MLDIGEMRVALEKESQKAGLHFYGDGKVDDLQTLSPVLEFAMDRVYRAHVSFPESWSRLMAYTANVALYGSRQELRGNLLRLAAITTAWIEDIDRREHAGKKRD